jgi:hypothetical protein
MCYIFNYSLALTASHVDFIANNSLLFVVLGIKGIYAGFYFCGGRTEG